MAKPNYIELGFGKHAQQIPILYEDRSVLAIDKPPGWMLVPFTWQNTNRNLQAAIVSSIAAGDYWAKSRNLKFLRNIHRLDAETTGILLFAKSQGGLETFSELFESRKMEKVYLAIVQGIPKEKEWVCQHRLEKDPDHIGKMKVDPLQGKDAETHFTFLRSHHDCSLVEARPVTGRTHQIRIHLTESGYPILGEPMYSKKAVSAQQLQSKFPLALRAAQLAYVDPFLKRKVQIDAPVRDFLRQYGFG